MTRQPARVCANCGVGVAAQSSFRRNFPFRTEGGKSFVVTGHLCHGCRSRFRNDDAAARFLIEELPSALRSTE